MKNEIQPESNQGRLEGTVFERPDDSWYTSGGMEPWVFIEANEMGFFEGSVVKYVTRHRKKNGLEDLLKARVYIEELIRQERKRLGMVDKLIRTEERLQ